MGNPKKRHSRWQRDKRRANWRLSLPAMVECPQCHEQKLAHVACPHCGWYKGRVAVVIPQKEEKR